MFQRLGPGRRIFGIAQAYIRDVLGSVAVGGQRSSHSRRQLRVDEELHGLPRNENGAICFAGALFKAG